MPGPGVRIERLARARAGAALTLLAAVFARHSAVHRTLGLSAEAYRAYLGGHFEAVVGRGLSLAAVDPETDSIVGCLVACDLADQPAPGAARPAALEPLAALLGELEGAYRRENSGAPGECLLVDMAAVDPGAAGRGIYRALREAAHRTGREAGYTRVVGELSSAATQHVCVSGFGHRVRAEIAYAAFEFRGARPFAAIREPPTIQLVEGDLD